MNERDFLRHALATLAYRAAKSVRGAPATFADFKASPTSRTPVEILAHMGDLMDWGPTICRGEPKFNVSTPLPWDQEVQRFFKAVTTWDQYLASDAPIHYSIDKIFQGPVADALTHTGQINFLRRLSGSPVKGESYPRSPIKIGQTGFEQPPATPGSEFD